MPHKQFTVADLRHQTQDFLRTAKSYRQTVRHQGKDISYDDRIQHPLAQRGAALAQSTIWRWLSWLASLTKTRRQARRLICQKDPSYRRHRDPIPIDPKKYRSDPRRLALQDAAQMLRVEEDFREKFETEIFPTFATGTAWR